MSGHVLLLALLAAGPQGTEPVPPGLRLPETVRPVRQAVDLTLDPQAELLTGTTEIGVEVLEAVRLLWLNARGLDLAEATLDTGSGPVAARVVPGGEDFVGFALAQPLAPGPAVLRVVFEAPISRREQSGVFTMEEAGDRYLFSQFQAIDARRAFPCFDEPAYKIPWQVTLRVPPGLVALSNAPAHESVSGDGLTIVRFAETPPLPSSLVAFAVGPFELVDLGRLGRTRVPSRLAVPRGRGRDTAWASATTPRVLGVLEDYFDRGYPYAKLDQVAVPGIEFAMEHPGLVTYGQSLMVQRAAEETLANRRDWLVYCAHELAHMWFGNLVTMAWWDDTWLNEAFAMWAEGRVASRLRPDWEMDLDRVANRSYALQSDSLSTARRIRQPIEDRDDIDEAFDSITYFKGEAVLEMIESWVGEDAFRRGIGAYLDHHAWGTATAKDLIDELSASAGQDVGPAFSSYLDQPGVPLVRAALVCGGTRPEIVLEQEPYRPLGAPEGARDRSWQVPVCAAYPADDGRHRDCGLLTAERGALTLSEDGCPAWVLSNAGMRGYYRLALGGDEARALLEQAGLTPSERLGVASDVEALVASGDLSAGDALALVSTLARDPHPRVVAAGVDLLSSLEAVVPDPALGAYEALVRRDFGGRARELGWTARTGDDEDTLLLRARVLRAVGTLGADAGLGEEAVPLARRWLRGDGGDPDMLATVLAVAARYEDRRLFDGMVEAARTEADRERRAYVLGALGEVRSPDLAREALGLLLDERVDPREAFDLAGRLSRGRATRPVLWAFLEENWEEVTGRLPASLVGYLPYLARRSCDPAGRAEIEAFLRPRVRGVDGGARSLDQALESIDQCVARRAAQQASAVAFLDGERSGPPASN